MNSLSELNGYAESATLPYTDLRAPNIIFATEPANQTQTVDEGFPFASSVGVEITEIINPAQSQPVYTIDVSSLPGTTVSWTSLPSGITVTNTTPGIYNLFGIQEVSDWTDVKSATITMPANYFGVWTYSSQIEYYSGATGNQIKRWTTAVTTNDVQFLLTPLEFVYTKDAVSNITNTPQIIDLDVAYPGATWTVTVTPSNISSVDTFSTTGTGGTFTVNGTTKIITISGTRTQVNSRLAGLQIDANSNAVDFALTYYATNSLNSSTDTKTQLLSSVGLLYLGAVTTPTFYFTEDAAESVVTGAPLITDSAYNGGGGYIYTITPSNTAAITNLRTIGATGTSTFNETTKVLTINGTRTEVNNRLATLRMLTAVDWGSDLIFSYTVVTPRYDSATKVQIIACGSNDTEVTNMNITRTYIANNDNLIFTNNTPSITDFDTSESTYTINFAVSSSLGFFGFGVNDTPVASLSFVGTKAQCNAKFAAVRFWPVAGVSSNGSFTYTQLKNGVQQVSQTVSLLGSAGSFTGTRKLVITTSGNWVPNVADALYGKISSLVLVGGGGGGAGGWTSPYISGRYGGGQGGNGGGVRYVAETINLVTNQSYPLSIGSGGTGGISEVGGSEANRVGGTGGTTTAFGYSIAGGGGGGTSVKSGPGIGSFYADDNGFLGGNSYERSDGIINGGGGGGHLSLNGGSGNGWNAVIATGGRGAYGFDEPNGAYSFLGAGGGGGGLGRGSAGSTAAGHGASSTSSATSGSFIGGGGGGGGGYASFPGAAGNRGSVILQIVAK